MPSMGVNRRDIRNKVATLETRSRHQKKNVCGSTNFKNSTFVAKIEQQETSNGTTRYQAQYKIPNRRQTTKQSFPTKRAD